MVSSQQARIVGLDDAPADTRRGGDLRTLLSPKSVGATSGFMGVGTIPAGDFVAEHYHPYSEMFIYNVKGDLVIRLDGVDHALPARHGVMVPPNMKYRIMNDGAEESLIVYHASPLAPRPDLGHVDTETRTDR